jgi:two-component system, cell cycle sensor histidine kinase and response regulator CckA
MHEDVTDLRRAEDALKESEKRFRLLVQNSNDIIQILNEQGVPSYISDQSIRILGYRPEELVGISPFPDIHPEDLLNVQSVLKRSLERPGEVQKVECRYRHKNGNWINVEAVGCNLLNDPSVQGIVLNIRDVTERAKAEQEQRKLQEQLQQAMKMEAVGRLAGGVAHDFNNLLTSINGNVQLALLDLKPNDPLADTLREIGRAADSAADMTRQLLAFSRKQLIEPKVIDLNDLIGSMIKMLGRLIGEDIELRTRRNENLGMVKIDPGQFEQILVNLAINARDAMPDGGKLIIETANVELDEEYCQVHTYSKPGSYVMLAVSDTGFGMSAEIKSHIFEPFFTTKEQGKGTGLGLATIYGTVKQAFGNVEVYSEEGKGTTFKIYLPRVEEKPEKLDKEKRAIDIQGGKETILLVEDEDLVRSLAIRILKRLGYKVICVASSGDALIAAEQYSESIHLLFTDVIMPGMNGRQLAERITKLHPETKMLFSSGYTEDVIAHHGVIDENLHFIGKPYTPDTLAKAIRNTLDKLPAHKSAFKE